MNEAIQKVMDEFNFAEVHRILQAADIHWSWDEEGCDSYFYAPDLPRIRQLARALLEEAANSPEDNYVQVCGLVAEKADGQLTLTYTLEWAGAELPCTSAASAQAS